MPPTERESARGSRRNFRHRATAARDPAFHANQVPLATIAVCTSWQKLSEGKVRLRSNSDRASSVSTTTAYKSGDATGDQDASNRYTDATGDTGEAAARQTP